MIGEDDIEKAHKTNSDSTDSADDSESYDSYREIKRAYSDRMVDPDADHGKADDHLRDDDPMKDLEKSMEDSIAESGWDPFAGRKATEEDVEKAFEETGVSLADEQIAL